MAPPKKSTHAQARAKIKTALVLGKWTPALLPGLKAAWQKHYGSVKDFKVYVAMGEKAQHNKHVLANSGKPIVKTIKVGKPISLSKLADANEAVSMGYHVTQEEVDKSLHGFVTPFDTTPMYKSLKQVMDEIALNLDSLEKAGLNQKAIVVLLCDSTKLSKTVINKVLKALKSLGEDYGVPEDDDLPDGIYQEEDPGVPF